MQTNVTTSHGIVVITAVLATFVVLVGAVVGPRPAFMLLCHQLPARSFTVDGHLFAVCQRCTGLYLGTFLGSIAGMLPTLRNVVSDRIVRFMAIAALLLVVDVGLDAVHILKNTPLTRVGTGLGLGLTAGLFLTSIIPNNQPANS